jgi:hypothetical protein
MARRLLQLGLALCGAAALVAGASSCGLEAKPTRGATVREASGGRGGSVVYRNPFEPRELRVHPLTRLEISPETGEPNIELYLELFDRWNHGVKALGTLVIELYETGGPVGAARGGELQLKLWKVDLTDPDENAVPYDRVTRTYHLTLADLPAGFSARRDPRLSVRFTTTSGEQLITVHRLGSP